MHAVLVTPLDDAVIVVSGGFPVGSAKVTEAEVSDVEIAIVKLVGDNVPVADDRVSETVGRSPGAPG